MPSNAKKSKNGEGQTEEDRHVQQETKRLRKRAEGRLLQATHETTLQEQSIPCALRKCDGADILKRQSSRKKKYLFVFPGTISLTPGAKIGALCGLDTRTPFLYVDYPPHGRLKMKGSLVFPSNPIIALKGGAKTQPVHVVDSFETLVVFSEWAWVGDEKSNPGDVPLPLPNFLKRKRQLAADLWETPGESASQRKAPKVARRKSRALSASSEEEEKALEVDKEAEQIVALDDSDSEAWKGDDVVVNEEEKSASVRVNPSRRNRNKVDYSQLFNEEDESEEVTEAHDVVDVDGV